MDKYFEKPYDLNNYVQKKTKELDEKIYGNNETTIDNNDSDLDMDDDDI